ncbi:MAG: helix-turn-helix domain-containing protein [Firmicutes bacterium]|nr:helix-turn-helix domain-containing protein [Bacillota bacterium]
MKSVQTKFFLSYLIIFVITLAITTGGSYYFIASSTMFSVNSGKKHNLEYCYESTDQHIQNLINLSMQMSDTAWIKKLSRYSSDKELSYFDMLTYTSELANIKAINRAINDIFIYFHKLDMVISTECHVSFQNFSEHSFNINTMAPSVQRHFFTDMSNNNTFTAVDVKSYGMLKNGFLYLQFLPIQEVYNPKITIAFFMNKEELQKELNNLAVINGGTAFIIDGEGHILLKDGMNNAPDITMSGLYDLRENSLEKIIINHKKYAVYKKVSRFTGWTYINLIPENINNRELNNIRINIILIVMLLLVFGVLFSRRLASSSYTPFAKLLNLLGANNVKVNEFFWLEGAISEIIEKESRIEKELKSQRTIIQQSYITKLLTGDFPYTETNGQFFKTIGINLTGTGVACIAVDYGAHLQFKKILYPCCTEIFDVLIQNRYILLCVLRDRSVFPDCLRLLSENLDGNIVAGVSNIHDTPAGASRAFSEAQTAVDYKLLFGKGQVIKYEEVSDRKPHYTYSHEQSKKLFNYLISGDEKKVINEIDEILRLNLFETNISIFAAKNLLMNILLDIAKVDAEFDINFVSGNFFEILQQNDIHEIAHQIILIVKNICLHIKKIKNDGKYRKGSKLVKYIDENYTDYNISLQRIAEQFSMSVWKVSKQIKDEMGVSYLEYINRKRIRLSMTLLETSDYDIAQIATLAGYTNDVTFRRVFKKYNKILPTEYRNIKRRD